MKITGYIILLLSIVLGCSLIGNALQYSNNKGLRSDIEKSQKQIDTLLITNSILAKKQTFVYEISLKPEINNKINSIMGSSREITMQYFFQMNGNEIKLKADSISKLKN